MADTGKDPDPTDPGNHYAKVVIRQPIQDVVQTDILSIEILFFYSPTLTSSQSLHKLERSQEKTGNYK
jgi:hypothetical protein